MLVIDKDFAEFNPSVDQWRLIWFSDFRETPQDICSSCGSWPQRLSATRT